jgi:hypothetical protein
MTADLYENRPISPTEAERIAYHFSASYHEFRIETATTCRKTYKRAISATWKMLWQKIGMYQAMSHTDNTAQKFDTNFPEWLALKLWIEHVDPVIQRSASRQAQKRIWLKDIEMELSE